MTGVPHSNLTRGEALAMMAYPGLGWPDEAYQAVTDAAIETGLHISLDGAAQFEFAVAEANLEVESAYQATLNLDTDPPTPVFFHAPVPEILDADDWQFAMAQGPPDVAQ